MRVEKLSRYTINNRATCGWLLTGWIPGRLCCLQTPGHGWGPCIYKQPISSLGQKKWKEAEKKRDAKCTRFPYRWGIQVVGSTRLNLNRVGFGATLHNFVYVKPRTGKKRADDTGTKEEGKKEIITSLQAIPVQRCRMGINWLTSFPWWEKIVR